VISRTLKILGFTRKKLRKIYVPHDPFRKEQWFICPPPNGVVGIPPGFFNIFSL
jgi:hypothetical protein